MALWIVSTSSSTVYAFTPTSDGATSRCGAGTFTDAAGNDNTASDQFNWTYDGTSPSITISSSDVSDGETTNDSSIALTFTTSEATSNFAEDIAVGGGSLTILCIKLNSLYSFIYTNR